MRYLLSFFLLIIQPALRWPGLYSPFDSMAWTPDPGPGLISFFVRNAGERSSFPVSHAMPVFARLSL